MAFLLPFNGEPDNIQRIQLGTQTYDFRFRWNSLEEAWYCSIGLNADTPKVQQKLVVGMDLLESHQAYEEVPKGSLVIMDSDQTYGRMGRDNVGIDKRFKIFYSEVGEDLSSFYEDT